MCNNNRRGRRALAKNAERCLSRRIRLGDFGQTTLKGASSLLSFRQLRHLLVLSLRALLAGHLILQKNYTGF